MSDIETHHLPANLGDKSQLWAAIEGPLVSNPRPRMPWQKTLRASVSVVDADGVERHVRVIGRTLRARTALALLK
ncbi:hypothetical protein ACRXB1_22715, partial [Caballeronia sp. M23-90]